MHLLGIYFIQETVLIAKDYIAYLKNYNLDWIKRSNTLSMKGKVDISPNFWHQLDYLIYEEEKLVVFRGVTEKIHYVQIH